MSLQSADFLVRREFILAIGQFPGIKGGIYRMIAQKATIMLIGLAVGHTFGTARAATNGLPRAKIKESVICCPREPVVLDGWASVAPGAEIVQWQWDLNGDGIADTSSTTGELAIMSPARPKTYLIILWVRDNRNNVSQPDSARLSVMNSPPQVSVNCDTFVKVGTRIIFEPRIAVSCGSIMLYQWDLDGDGKFEYQSRDDGRTSKAFYKPGHTRPASARSIILVTKRARSK